MTPRHALEAARQNPDYVDLTELPNVRVDLRYGTINNLLGVDVYGGFQRALLHRDAAAKFHKASDFLAAHHPTLSFLIFDALRPQTAQRQFWNLVKGTPQQPYFADPAKGSIHSYGFAIDLTLTNEGGELEMGTGFDDLSPLAEPKLEQEFLRAGKLSASHIKNRLILREVMVEAGFIQLPHEWWHFDALPPAEVRAAYRLVE